MKKNTRCVHSGSYMDGSAGGLNTPIFTSSSFQYLDVSENIYPRYYNTPNQKTVVEKLCALENAEDGLLFSSGMAAISTVMLALLKKGDHVILQRDIYGGTHHFVTSEFEKFGISFTFVSNDPQEFENAIGKNTALIFIESPSNPLLLITDIDAVCQIARANDILCVIDNTFATPINQNPLDFGIDIVIHSGTKYLGGHSDLCCGAALSSQSLIEKIKFSASNFGGSLNALTCYMLERSLKTLGIRIGKQNRNAHVLGQYLQTHPKVKKVNYPGLKDHPGFEIAKRQMRQFGGMLSFELDERAIDPTRFLKKLRLITPALSLGGVETIICSPAATSHAKISDEERAELGITPGLLRLSVGIEDTADLMADIEQAFSD